MSKFVFAVARLLRIQRSPALTDKEKYELVFDAGLDWLRQYVDWHDPDMGYGDDVAAFMDAAAAQARRYQAFLGEATSGPPYTTLDIMQYPVLGVKL